MKYFLIIVFSTLFAFCYGQDTTGSKTNEIKQYNLIKLGSSVQMDVFFFNGYDYYYEYPGSRSYYEGPNLKTFVAYEHIWEYPQKIALSLEPVLGISFYEKTNLFFIGNNAKFYWANLDIWRMGIAIYTGYGYGYGDATFYVPMDGGNYHQRMDVNLHYHQFSANISLIPFQFRLRSIPLIIESQFALGGLNILWERSERFSNVEGADNYHFESFAYPYFFKTELKIGFVLP